MNFWKRDAGRSKMERIGNIDIRKNMEAEEKF